MNKWGVCIHVYSLAEFETSYMQHFLQLHDVQYIYDIGCLF